MCGARAGLSRSRGNAADGGARRPVWLAACAARGRELLTFALASALFAALTSILGKVGISGVDPTLGTAVRTLVVLAMAWVIVGAQGRLSEVRSIPGRELTFIVASGAATCASWLAYYHALKDGPASVVVPIDKLSILVTVAVSAVAFHAALPARPGPDVRGDGGHGGGVDSCLLGVLVALFFF